MGLLGFTFGFGARDEGLGTAMAGASTSIDRLNKSLDDTDKVAKKMSLKGALDALNTVKLSRVQSGIDQLIGGPQTITSSLEATLFAMHNEARVFTAQMGLAGRENSRVASQISGMAFSMNIGVEQVGKGFQAMANLSAKFRKELGKAGLGLKDFLKAQKATGVGADQMLMTMGNLAETYGFSGEQAKIFLDRFTATATAGGQGEVAFKNLSTSIDSVTESIQANQEWKMRPLEERQK